MRFRLNGKHAARTLRRKIVALPALGALALAPVLVHPGDTMSGIAASHGVSLGAVEAANPQVGNPNLIYAGQLINLPGGGGAAPSTGGLSYGHPNYCGDGDGDGWDVSCGHAAPQATPAHAAPAYSQPASAPAPASGGYSSGSLSDVPGVPRSFAACVARAESSSGANQAYNGGVYGIINASGYHVNGQSVAAQKQAFAELYRKLGDRPWAPYDGCHG